MKLLRTEEIPFIVAPFEADAQLARLYRTKQIDLVVTEDSDLSAAYGCDVFTKLKKTGYGYSLKIDEVLSSTASKFDGFPLQKLRLYAILSCCDFYQCKGIGPANAYEIMMAIDSKSTTNITVKDIAQKTKELKNIILDEIAFDEADKIFQSQLVWSPQQQKLVKLNDEIINNNNLHTAMNANDTNIINSADQLWLDIVNGVFDPSTKKKYIDDGNNIQLYHHPKEKYIENIDHDNDDELIEDADDDDDPIIEDAADDDGDISNDINDPLIPNYSKLQDRTTVKLKFSTFINNSNFSTQDQKLISDIIDQCSLVSSLGSFVWNASLLKTMETNTNNNNALMKELSQKLTQTYVQQILSAIYAVLTDTTPKLKDMSPFEEAKDILKNNNNANLIAKKLTAIPNLPLFLNDIPKEMLTSLNNLLNRDFPRRIKEISEAFLNILVDEDTELSQDDCKKFQLHIILKKYLNNHMWMDATLENSFDKIQTLLDDWADENQGFLL